MNKKQILFALIAILMGSCMSSCKIKELQLRQKQLTDENASLKQKTEELSVKTTECNSALADCDKKSKQLESDTASLGSEMRDLKTNLSNCDKSFTALSSEYSKLEKGHADESKKLIGKLQSTQEDLLVKEDALKKLASELSVKESSLNMANAELKKREARVKELQMILSRKDSTVAALKNKVVEALLGFKDKGLTVEQRNGKVYVSLEERLLFASGSTVVDKKGEEAIKELAKVLEKNLDINVLIEGHTDNVPISTPTIKDNWDLSTMRATAIVRIITANKNVDPKRLTAAGRSQYLPIDAANTPEARKKNRRTEIILSPKLDELLKVLENN